MDEGGQKVDGLHARPSILGPHLRLSGKFTVNTSCPIRDHTDGGRLSGQQQGKGAQCPSGLTTRSGAEVGGAPSPPSNPPRACLGAKARRRVGIRGGGLQALTHMYKHKQTPSQTNTDTQRL